jgi:hypothetical protein
MTQEALNTLQARLEAAAAAVARHIDQQLMALYASTERPVPALRSWDDATRCWTGMLRIAS